MKNNGFTLTEMMIVLVIICGLMFLVIPNISNTRNNIDGMTCDAYQTLVNSQIQAYFFEHGVYPTLEDLTEGEYIYSSHCPDGTPLIIENNRVKVDVE